MNEIENHYQPIALVSTIASGLPRRGDELVKMMLDRHAAGGQSSMQCSFLMAARAKHLTATGVRRTLQPGPADTLAARVRDFFASDGAPSGRTLVGALPFDRQEDDYLFEPEVLSHAPLAAPATGPRPDRRWQVTPQPTCAEYKIAVARALEIIAASKTDAAPLDKIVLSRSVLLEARPPIDIMALSSRLLGDPGAVRFLTALPAGSGGAARHLVGATPELLVSKAGDAVLSHPLAGSARRSPDAAADRAAADGLVHSAKDQREHRWVAEAILDGLAPYCRDLSAPREPELVSTQTMWHLGTRIAGRLKDPESVSSAELAAVMHPTPAVGGTPRDRAMALIPQLEGYDRGFYAGAVGWTDSAGDGEWYVSLRCAEVTGSQVRIYAGAGIVEGSVPEEEAEETSAKLQAMLRALGVDEQGHRDGGPVAETCVTAQSGTGR